jgi:ribonuclease-3
MTFSPRRFIQTRILRRGNRLKKKGELEKSLGIRIKKEEYFVEALTHRSALSFSSNERKRSNERMEYLGDAVLNLLVAEFLFNEYPELDEGQMTRLRSLLVNQHALAECAAELDLSNFMALSSSAQQAIERGYETIISDAFEAVIAAIYLDGGIKAARSFIAQAVMPREREIGKGTFKTLDKNFKSALLELAQSRGLGAPRYNLIKEEGPDHDRTFTVEVLVGEESRGIGSGKTKKAAEQMAAEAAFENLKGEQAKQKDDRDDTAA